jgi:hypothetical protein
MAEKMFALVNGANKGIGREIARPCATHRVNKNIGPSLNLSNRVDLLISNASEVNRLWITVIDYIVSDFDR